MFIESQITFFGESITVAGLITGQDLLGQLKGKSLGDALIIPKSMLKKRRTGILRRHDN